MRAGSSRTQIRGLPSRSCLLGLSESCGDPGVSEPTSVGLDVHTRSVVAVAIDGSPAASLPAAPQSASSPGSPAPPSVLVHGSVSGDRILITYLCVDLAFRGSGIALSLNERLRDEGDDSEPPTSLPATSTPMWPWAASTPDSATADCTARLASSDISMPPPLASPGSQVVLHFRNDFLPAGGTSSALTRVSPRPEGVSSIEPYRLPQFVHRRPPTSRSADSVRTPAADALLATRPPTEALRRAPVERALPSDGKSRILQSRPRGYSSPGSAARSGV